MTSEWAARLKEVGADQVAFELTHKGHTPAEIMDFLEKEGVDLKTVTWPLPEDNSEMRYKPRLRKNQK